MLSGLPDLQGKNLADGPELDPQDAGGSEKARLFRQVSAQRRGLLLYTHACTLALVKRRELERRLRELGWAFQRHGGKHDVWTSLDGSFTEFVPRHTEISEKLAQVILNRAKERK